MDDPGIVKLVYKKHTLEGKSNSQIARDLNISEYKVKKILKRADEFLSEYDRAEVAKYFMDNLETIKQDFNEIRDEIKDIIMHSKEKGSEMKRLAALREWKSVLELSLRRLGELQNGLTTIKTEKVNIKNLNQIAIQMRERLWDENKAEEKDGAIILKSPKPEVMNDYLKWKKKVAQ